MKKLKKKYLIIMVMCIILILIGITYKIYAKYVLSENIIAFHIDKLMEDKIKPTIDAIDPDNNDTSLTDEEYYTNKDTTIDYDDNIKVETAKYWYNEDEKEFHGEGNDFESGTIFSDEGWYKIEVTDIFENKNTVILLIDKTAPTINADATNISDETQNRSTSSSIDSNEFKMWFNSDVDLSEYDKYGIQYTCYKENVNEQVFNSISEEKRDIGKGIVDVWNLTTKNYYLITATDLCKNTSTLVIGIDKIRPSILTLSANDTKSNKDITIQYNDDFSGIKSAKYSFNANADSFTTYTDINNDTTFSDNGYYHIVLEDVAGNINEYTVAIDKVSPVISVKPDGKETENYPNTTNDVVNESTDITLTTDDNFSIDYNEYWYNPSSNSFSGDGTKFENGEKLTDDGYYKITAHDTFGNTTTIIILLDKTPPEVTVTFRKKADISLININDILRNGGVVNG